MISVILSVQENESAALAHTLQNLVSFAIDGLVVEVTLLHDKLDNTTQILADEAGCIMRSQANGLKPVFDDARGDWLLFMETGSTLEAGWSDVVHAHAMADGGAAYFKLEVSDVRSWWQRILKPRTHSSPLAKGLLISKRQARANFKEQTSAVELMRGLALKPLSASIRPAPIKAI